MDFIKADCMMCQPCYTKEIEMFSAAVEKVNRTVALSCTYAHSLQYS